MSATSDEISGVGVASIDALGRRFRTEEFRRRVVAEALAPEASVAVVARRNGLNANLVFKWIRRSREGWPDKRRRKDAAQPIQREPGFARITLVDDRAPQLPTPAAMLIDATAPAPLPVPKPRKAGRRRGVIEIALPDGARINVDADVDAEALRRVLSVLGDL
ncbi:MAG: transposase family protein [Methylocystaceae bacterium]|nr:MAG: transposase family protein [Methylocystaceae bacterium]KAF0205266.1 MAG: transposase family [Methylocystaceae bacterium]TND00718.1 MAG: transposase IS3/IS911 family protein [Gammaproteobacteria bacterium]